MTMHLIQRVKPTTTTNPISFINIPSDYTHLQLRYNARASQAATSSSVYIIINNQTGATDWSHHSIFSTGGGITRVAGNATNSPTLSAAIPAANGLANTYGVGVVDIYDYSSTTVRKHYKAIYGQNQNATTAGVVGIASAQPVNLAASTQVNRLDIYFDGGAVAGSTFSLYGITANNTTGA